MVHSNLKKIMEEKQISIRDLVYGTGISNMTILRARNEQILQCKLVTLQSIAQFLGVKTKDLYEED